MIGFGLVALAVGIVMLVHDTVPVFALLLTAAGFIFLVMGIRGEERISFGNESEIAVV
jgi:hypothetical protein